MLKFKGNYRELKNIGYIFGKSFAGNYINYKKNDIVIWKKNNEIELLNIPKLEKEVLEYLIEKDFNCEKLTLNLKLEKVVDYDLEKHEAFMVHINGGDVRECYDTYHIYIPSKQELLTLKELYDLDYLDL